MRLKISLALCAGLIFLTIPKAWADAAFCTGLKAADPQSFQFSEDKLYYRHPASHKITQLISGQSIDRGIKELTYFIRARPDQIGQKSVLNLKFVYAVAAPVNYQDIVGLENDRWFASQELRNRSLAACSKVTVEG